jgi:hypothetical protein
MTFPRCPDKIDKHNLERLNDLPELPGLQLVFSAYYLEILFHMSHRMLGKRLVRSGVDILFPA